MADTATRTGGPVALPPAEQLALLASHELRTPVSIIHTSGQLLRDDPTPDPSRQRYIGQVIMRQAEVLQRLAHALSAVATPRRGSGSADLLSALAAAHSELADTPGTAEVHMRGRSIPRVRMHGDLLRIVLFNVLANAAKHALTDTTVDVLVVPDGRSIRVTVTNQSLPIPPAARQRVFEPFFQFAATASGGMGLGLFLVRLLVERHGGSVTFHATDGDPATVTVSVLLPSVR